MRHEDLILGTWGLSGSFGKKSDNEILAVIEYALSRGIYKFDTAMVYGGGRVEELLGSLTSERLSIATKVPAMVRPNRSDNTSISSAYPAKYLQAMVEGCFKRLGKQRVSVLQLHNWSEHWEADQVIEVLEPLKCSGDIDAIGVSLPDFYSGPLPRSFDIIQLPFNQIQTWAATVEIPINTKLWARSLLAHGLLAGRKVSDLDLGDERIKKFAKFGNGKSLPRNIEVNRSYQFVKEHQNRFSNFIFGATTIDQVDIALRELCS